MNNISRIRKALEAANELKWLELQILFETRGGRSLTLAKRERLEEQIYKGTCYDKEYIKEKNARESNS